MKSRSALKRLAEVSEAQWGLVTSMQARARGVSHMTLTRLVESGELVRISHGVYRDAGAPGGAFDDLRAAWLSTDPSRLAYERLAEHPPRAVVSGESASRLYGIGDLRGSISEFTTPTRKQTQRRDVRYRTRVFPEQDVTVKEGLPVTTRERTIADLVEARQDLSIVGDVLRDAARQSRLDTDRLVDLLSPLAARNGHAKGDGSGLLAELFRIAGIDAEGLAAQAVGIPGFGALVTARYFENLTKSDFTFHELLQALKSVRIPKIEPVALAAVAGVLRQLPQVPSQEMFRTIAQVVSSWSPLVAQLKANDRTELAAEVPASMPEGEAVGT
ncbi:MAG: type IV toxin-antitoxin system AbiEi family antitoxin domain-containing protein [Pseudoclavibacter sp.]